MPKGKITAGQNARRGRGEVEMTGLVQWQVARGLDWTGPHGGLAKA
jgi:hypothetical protein